jgi:hypothetical protein
LTRKQKRLKFGVSRELKDNILASKLLVNSREGIELVLERSGILAIKGAINTYKQLDPAVVRISISLTS